MLKTQPRITHSRPLRPNFSDTIPNNHSHRKEKTMEEFEIIGGGYVTEEFDAETERMLTEF